MTTPWRRGLLYTLATSDRFEATVRRWSPLEEQAYRLLRRFVAGTTLDDAVGVIEDLSRMELGVSLDLFGEGATDAEQVARVVAGSRAGREGPLRSDLPSLRRPVVPLWDASTGRSSRTVS